MRPFFYSTVFALGLALALPVAAQDRDQTLADIRQEMSLFFNEVQGLKRELSTTGTAGGGALGVGAGTIQRVDAIEQQLIQLTAKAEQLENRINRIVADGTNRIGDLEFRLVELEGGDIGALGDTSTLGGGEVVVAGIAPSGGVTAVDTGQAELAIGEKRDFDNAQKALNSGDFLGAAEKFATFAQNYPGGPLSGQAHFLRGEALAQVSDWNSAARAYLESFSGSPDASSAPLALYKLGLSLNELGQSSEACLMLREVSTRYPASDQVTPAQTSLQALNCG